MRSPSRFHGGRGADALLLPVKYPLTSAEKGVYASYTRQKDQRNLSRCRGQPHPLIGRFCPSCSGILAATELDWNYTLEVDVKDLKNHKCKFVNGDDHDGMPSYKACMKAKPIYYRPAPGYSFNNFLSMYPPKEIDFVDHRIRNTVRTSQLLPAIACLAMLIGTGIAHADATVGVTTGAQWHEPTIDMAFVAVPGGCYAMGTPDGTTPFWRLFGVTEIETENERPVHEVCVGDFWLGKYEVTVAQYLRFVTATNSHFPAWLAPGGEHNLRTGTNDWYRKLEPAVEASNNPIIGVSWRDAVAFTAWLSKTSGHTYRLPTEAEWEYACRSGGKQERHAGGSQHPYEDIGWDSHNSGKMPRRVGTKAPNGLGLYDMSGNVNEFTADTFRKDAYRYHTRDNPIYVDEKEERRVIRGGSWFDGRSGNLRCARRREFNSRSSSGDVGFRVLRAASDAKNAK